MFCPKCNSYNEDGNAFCVHCGLTFFQAEPPPTVMAPGVFPDPNPSQPTVIHSQIPQVTPIQPPPTDPQFQNSYAAFQQSFPAIPPAGSVETQSRAGLYIALGVIGLLFIGIGAAVVIYLAGPVVKTGDVLPASFGLYLKSTEKSKLTEIKKADYRNAADARDAIKNETPLAADSKPNLILYSDAKDIPISDLRLIEIDSIKNDGSLRQIEFKAATIDGKPDMKRIWVEQELAAGRYAFALIDGFFDDGKHHFWPFEVKTSGRKENGDLARLQTISVKTKSPTPTPKPEKTPEPKVSPPPDTTVRYSNTSNLVLRAGPSQTAGKLGTIASGQKLYVIEYSDNWEWFVTKDGREINSNYAYVQTESGKRGWVYAAFIK